MTRKYETVEACVKRIETGFREKYNRDEKFRNSLKGKNRKILLEITDGTMYHFDVVEGDLKNVGPGRVEKPDVRVTTTGEHLLQLFNKEINPVQAYLTRKIVIHAPLGDILFVKSLLG